MYLLATTLRVLSYPVQSCPCERKYCTDVLKIPTVGIVHEAISHSFRKSLAQLLGLENFEKLVVVLVNFAHSGEEFGDLGTIPYREKFGKFENNWKSNRSKRG
jgi:hypothetical protein